MRYIFVFIIFSGFSGPCAAQDASPTLKKCLPPLSGDVFKADECSLTHRPLKPLSEKLKIAECNFLAGNMALDGKLYRLLQCTALNISEHPIKSFRYGVRYLKQGTMMTVAKAGFSTSRRFATPNFQEHLPPGEARILTFIGPPLPEGASKSQVMVQVEVLGIQTEGQFR